MGGGDGGEGSGGGAHLSVITAITLSGCSLLFLALLRSRLAQKEEGLEPPPGSALVSSEVNERKKKKKTKENVGVRFSEDVGDHPGNGAEPRTRLRARSAPDRPGHGGRQAEDPQERKRKAVLCRGGGVASGGENPPIPANRRALYRGMCQYRSQMATLMLYHA